MLKVDQHISFSDKTYLLNMMFFNRAKPSHHCQRKRLTQPDVVMSSIKVLRPTNAVQAEKWSSV